MNNLKNNYNFKRLSKLGDSSWEDIIDRLIKTLIDRGTTISKDDLDWLLKGYYFLPNSPALLTAGNDEFYASACSAMPISDTMDGNQFSILEMLNLGIRLTKAGIGVGWNFSNLRSKLEPVKGKVGLTGGPVSFLKAYNGFLKEVTQCTRKAAAMGLLHVNHPDVIDFIKCKEQDGNIANFNLSVVIDDDFMNAVKNKKTYTQHYRKTGEKIEVDAEQIFNVMCESMYNNGEPGVMFSSHIKNDYFENLNDSNILANPCFSRDTLIVTDEGLLRIEELIGKSINIHNGNGWQKVDNFRVTAENQEILKIIIEDGSEIKVTPYHTMILEDGSRIKAGELKVGSVLKDCLIEINGKKEEKGAYLKGFLVGDGSVHSGKPELLVYAPKYCCENRLITSAKEIETEEVYHNTITEFGFICNGGSVNGRKRMQGLTSIKKELLPYCSYFKSQLPNEVFVWDHSSKCEFIAGLFDSDGTSSDTLNGFMYQIASIEKQFLLDLQMLLKTIGVRSKVSLMKESDFTDFNDGYGKYNTKACYRLTISQKASKKLAEQVKFERLKDFSDKKIAYNSKSKWSKIVSISKQEEIEDKVYCCTVDNNHSLALGVGILCGQCGESIMTYSDKPGEEYLELCVLGSINLPRFMAASEKDKKQIVYLAVDLLNAIIDLQNYVSPLQERGMKKLTRKIGIGLAGLSTVFAQKGIKYSSKEAKDLTKSIFKYIGNAAKVKSEYLYEQNHSVLLDSSPLHKLKRMNASLISVAPTSTLSSIFDYVNNEGCSFGLEPYFEIEPQIIKNSYGEFERNEKIVEILGLDKAKELIETADNLSYVDHLGILEAYYEANEPGITMSASKTINFKNNITIEDVKKAVFYCWEHKIKAFTFYRSGSRKDQVMNKKGDTYQDCIELDPKTKRPTDIWVHQSPKRPEYLEADIHHVQSESKKWLVLVGLYKGKPYEVFAGNEDSISIPKKHKTCKIKKNGGYHLIVGEGDDELVIKDIPAAFKNPQYASLTRIISFSLRHGGPLKFCCEQLLKEGGFDAFNKAVARCLKKYIKENEDSTQKCPECGGKMTYIQGCPTCECGYTKCG